MNAVYVEALNDRRFFSVLDWDNQGLAIATFSLKSDGEDPFYRAKLTRKRQLAGQTKTVQDLEFCCFPPISTSQGQLEDQNSVLPSLHPLAQG